MFPEEHDRLINGKHFMCSNTLCFSFIASSVTNINFKNLDNVYVKTSNHWQIKMSENANDLIWFYQLSKNDSWQKNNKWLDKSLQRNYQRKKISTYTYWNYGSSFPSTFTAFSLNLFECLHFCISSVFAFMQLASALRIQSFSDKQTSHFLVPHL